MGTPKSGVRPDLTIADSVTTMDLSATLVNFAFETTPEIPELQILSTTGGGETIKAAGVFNSTLTLTCAVPDEYGDLLGPLMAMSIRGEELTCNLQPKAAATSTPNNPTLQFKGRLSAVPAAGSAAGEIDTIDLEIGVSGVPTVSIANPDVFQAFTAAYTAATVTPTVSS